MKFQGFMSQDSSGMGNVHRTLRVKKWNNMIPKGPGAGFRTTEQRL